MKETKPMLTTETKQPASVFEFETRTTTTCPILGSTSRFERRRRHLRATRAERRLQLARLLGACDRTQALRIYAGNATREAALAAETKGWEDRGA